MLDTVALLKRLADGGVEFVVIGGAAAVAYGGSVTTDDLDVCAPLHPDNVVRIVKAMDGLHPRWRTPHVSTILTGSIVSIAAGVLPIRVLSVLVSMGTLLAFVLVCIGILILRRTSPEIPRPFRTPGLPYVPLLGAAFCLVRPHGGHGHG